MEEPDTLNGERKATDDEEPLPLVIRMPIDIRSLALTVIAVSLGILLIQYAQSVLIPIALGVLISYALMPLVGSLARIHVPRVLGAAIAVMLLVGGTGLGVYTLSDDAMAIVADVPQAARRLRERVVTHRSQPTGMLTQVQEAAREIEKTADIATSATNEPARTPSRDAVQRVQVVQPAFRASDYIWMGGVGLFGFLGQAIVILFLVYFLLVTGDLYKRKLVKIAGPTLSKKKVTVQILDDINSQIESFIKVQVITSLVVAVATSAVLWWLGLEQLRRLGSARRSVQLDPVPGACGRERRPGRGRLHAVQRSRPDGVRLRRRTPHHRPGGLPPDAGAPGSCSSDESSRDLCGSVVLDLDVGRVGDCARGADADDVQEHLRSRRGLAADWGVVGRIAVSCQLSARVLEQLIALR